MITGFQLFCLISILAITVLGGYFPLFRYARVKDSGGFPAGEAFSAGVFIALALTIMLPAGFKLCQKAFPQFNYPLASLIAIFSFLLLLSLEHMIVHLKEQKESVDSNRIDFIIPIIMTLMIAVPSFFLGTAIGVSGDTDTAFFIFIAVMLHKGSAGFALALKMMKSGMSRSQAISVYCFFAFATPIGILFGEEIHAYLGWDFMLLVKAIVLSLASGVFLYMTTLHEFRHSALIAHCCHKRGFIIMLLGFILTAFVRFLMGEAHNFH